MNKLIITLLIPILLGMSQANYAEEQVPGFMHPEVLQAAAAIKLTDEQITPFREAVGAFVNGRMQAFNLLMRKNNQTNLPRKMKSKTNALLKEMDKTMAGFLTEEQIPAYKKYRAKLKAKLRG